MIPTNCGLLQKENEVHFNIENCEGDIMNLDTIIADVIAEFSLNQKQKVAFRLAVTNVVKRELKEEVKQIIAHIKGPRGTEKSQVIKTIVAFHKELKLRHLLARTLVGLLKISVAVQPRILQDNISIQYRGIETFLEKKLSDICGQNI